ncbi:MAG: ATP-binding protein [Egibacteraceae bacterium]
MDFEEDHATMADFVLGAPVDAGGMRRREPLAYDADDLTTHGVILGMTGSGKTGLGVVLIEEALRAGIPALVIDPKGDMGNLALRFPHARPEDFAPWVDRTDAAEVATTWREGLASWGIGPDELRAYAEGPDVTIYTPGSSMGVPLNMLGSLSPPPLSWDTEAEALRDEIQGYVTGLLAMAGLEAEPLSPQVTLLATIVETGWRQGRQMQLPELLAHIHTPPFRKLGVFDVDQFFPADRRDALALQLNSLLASPRMTEWLQGPPLDPKTLLHHPDGQPRCAIVSVAHLSEDERQSIVTLLLSKVVTWMRGLPGTSTLRALVYMDEVAGYAPPSAVPPAKRPILTLLKQARAFGVGMVLATQNPADLDYKALSNAGTWMIGRLQTERDKARLLDGLSGAAGGIDAAALDPLISGLGQRRFLLHRSGGQPPVVFETRWAMSYLRGPMTREEIARVTGPASGPAVAAPIASPPEVAEDEVPVLPKVADGVPLRWLDPAAPWAAQVGALGVGAAAGGRYEAAVAARVHLRYDDARAGIHHIEEWEAVWFPLAGELDPAAAIHVDYDDRDLRTAPVEEARYAVPVAPIGRTVFFRSAARDLKTYLAREQTLTVYRNTVLKLYSRLDEAPEAFGRRCSVVAQDLADKEIAQVAARFKTRLDRERRQAEDAARRVDDAEVDASSRRNQEFLAGAGAVVGALFGGRGGVRRAAWSMQGVASRRGMTTRSSQRLETLRCKLADEQADLADLQHDMEEAIGEADQEWAHKAKAIEEVKLTLSSTDVTVDEVVLLWIPV